MKQKKQWAGLAFDALLISMMTIAVTALFFVVPLSFAILDSSKTLREQYDLAEIFLNIRNASLRSAVEIDVSDRDIVIVNTGDQPTRDGYAVILDSVISASPKVVGLDILFAKRKNAMDFDDPEQAQQALDADAYLERLLSCSDVVVSPCRLGRTSKADDIQMDTVTLPFYYKEGTHIGAININKTGVSRSCKTFSQKLSSESGEFLTLPAAMALLVDPTVEQKLARKKNIEKIYFDASCFSVIDFKTLNNQMDRLKDKYVFVGDLNFDGDRHITPIDYEMPGTKIQAMAFDTIINNHYIKTTSPFVSWLLAFLIVLFLLPLMGLARKNKWTEVLIPLFQALLIFLTVYLAYIIFVWIRFVPNVVYMMLSIGFMDVCRNLYYKIKETIKR